jgi:hypothetical protein
VKNVLVVLLLVIAGKVASQTVTEWKAADVIAMNVPDSSRRSAVSLGTYFSHTFKSPSMRARAAYTWTATSLSYDVGRMHNIGAVPADDDLVAKTLESRKALCQGYAAVLVAILSECGIEAFTVNGFTRQNGRINEISHAWVIARIDTAWYGFDPTWGSGYLNKNRFVRSFNPQFFMIMPAVLIRDHMPFDPVFQCLTHPLSTRDFLDGLSQASVTGDPWMFADSLRSWDELSQLSKCQASLRRLQESGVVVSLQMEWENYLKECVRNGKINQSNKEKNLYVRQFNAAVLSFNNCITAFNRYVDYFNGGFYPNRPVIEVKGMLDVCYAYLDSCEMNLTTVIAADPDISQSKAQLQSAVNSTRKNLDQQMVFVKIYYNTDPVARPGLFKQYNKLGLPKTR